MTFDDWWEEYVASNSVTNDSYIDSEESWEAGVREGIQRMNFLYDVCPECRELAGRHKMDCGRGR